MSKYIVENNIRKVIPYYTDFQTFVKKRWEGKTIIDIYESDFGECEENILDDIESEKLYIVTNSNKPNDQSILTGVDKLTKRKLDEKDIICHTKHRHEPPIPWYNDIIKLIYEDNEILVVDKPSGIPTHPTGNYYHNSLSEIIKQQYNMDSIWTCHRLDKVTSGVLVLAKTKNGGVKFLKLMRDSKQHTKKTYLARVSGKFPEGIHQYRCPIFAVNMNGYLMSGNMEELPTDSTTVFEQIKYNACLDQSLIKCIPITGKFHQIRIHLRNLGFPIVNDSFYQPDKQKNQLTLQKCNIERQLYSKLFVKYPQFENFNDKNNLTIVDSHINLLEIIDWHNDEKLKDLLLKLRKGHVEMLAQQKLINCNECKRSLIDTEYKLNSMVWLHALSFKYDNYHFETDYPDWANI